MDVCLDDSVKTGISYIREKSGRLDVLVNNAGFGIAGSVEDTSIEEAKSQFETNFFGVLRILREVLPVMRSQRSGLVINISSVGGLIGLPYQALYSASKFALEGLSEGLRLELRPFGIRVVLIEPGDFNTQFTTNRQKTKGSETNPIYQDYFARALSVMKEDEKNGADPKEIAFLVERIIKAKSPRFRYLVGPFPEKLAVLLKRFAPSLLEEALIKHYKIK